jgi:hypothetical protein
VTIQLAYKHFKMKKAHCFPTTDQHYHLSHQFTFTPLASHLIEANIYAMLDTDSKRGQDVS